MRWGNAYPDGVMVVPSDLLRELTEEAVLVPRLQPQNPTNKPQQQNYIRQEHHITSHDDKIRKISNYE
jgi:hypothetical protein